MSVGFARLRLDEKIPVFNSLEEWEPVKSTKMDICAKMCSHLLSSDDAPDMDFCNGTVTFPPLPTPNTGERVTQETKILIYQEFPSLGPLLRNVRVLHFCIFCYVFGSYNLQLLDLYGLRYAFIDGQMTFAQRAKVVATFNRDPTLRILIISSVGSAGLNLTAASTIIFLVCISHFFFFHAQLFFRTSPGVLKMSAKSGGVPTASHRERWSSATTFWQMKPLILFCLVWHGESMR
jgi:hypothetical protein